jgi:hypothetical protein
MSYKVIQWATGGVGIQLLRETITNPDLELVGVKVFTEAKDGRDAGAIAGLPDTGVIATRDTEAILALDADVVLHAPLASDMNEVDVDVIRLLRSGKNVISTAGYYGPQARGQAVFDRLEAACHAGNATLHGSGIEPGFVFDRLAPTLTSMCLELDHLKMVEAANGAQHPETSLIIDALGMGKPLDQMTIETPFGAYFSAFFGEVMAGVAHTLGLELERVDRGLDVLPATRDLEIASGFVAAGTVALTRYWLSGIVDGREKLRIEINWFVEDGLEGVPVPEGNCRWHIEIEGRPSGRVTFDLLPTLTGPGDYDPIFYSTMSTTIRTIPGVVAADPGILQGPVFAPYAPRLDQRPAELGITR